MDLIDEFVRMLVCCREEKLGEDLYRLFDEGSKYIRNIPFEQRALALKRLLAGENGLLLFLEVETDERNVPKDFTKAILEGFHFLLFILNEYVDVYKLYATQTMKLSINVLTRKGNFYLKCAASQVCIRLLRSFPNGDFQLQNVITEWMAKINLYELTDVSLLLRVMCAVAFHQPDVVESPDTLKRLLINHFNKMYETRKVFDKDRVHAMKMNIESMHSMFYNFPLESDDVILPKLYGRIKHIAEVAEKNEDPTLITSILYFLNRQMAVFQAFIQSDHEFWHLYFTRQTNSDTNSELAIESLKVYYEVIGRLLCEDDSEYNQTILRSLNTLFIKNITDECLSSKDLRLSINGYSLISESIKKAYGEAAVEEMYSTIARRTLSLYFSEDEAHGRFDEIADYQEALSHIILHITHVSSDQIKQLSKLCTIMIKRFPELSPRSQRYSVNSLKKTICNVESLKIHVSREFITSIIFEGIIWSCSHSLLIDAELQYELENLSKRPISYKDYVPLWKGLLDPKNYQRMTVPQQITNQVIETCIKLIEKLNLTIRTRENNVYSDLAVSQVAENETDFRIFLNLVDLYDEILDDLDSYCIIDKLPLFLYKIIKTSYKHPLISGFYRFVDRMLNVTDYFQDQATVCPELFKMVLQYLYKILESVNQYSHELQVSCVQLILHIPMIFATRIIEEIVPIFKIALSIGLNHYGLANSALQSLEQYILVKNDETKRLIQQLMVPLELYLRSKESIEIRIDTSEGQLKTARESDEGLEKLQKRILLFFGKIDNSLVFEFLYKQSLNTGSSWDKKDLLKYSLNFPDVNLDIYLDKMLPRIIELALNSSDRRIKLAASEVIHSIVAILLGKTVQFLSADADRFAFLYKTLCPVILRLGCDSDEVIRRLYNPLMLQMTHWLSSKLMLYSPAVGFLVDALFDGLSDEANYALRDFSGICLAEFTRWTIKQSSDHDLARAPININTIVESITNLALHPSHCRRVAAVIAFNYLHRILSENDEVVNIFWLELFYSFVKSMNGCNDINIWDSIDHVEKVLINKSRMFNRVDSRRKIPAEFSGSTLKDALYWLLSQCGILDENARRKSMELFGSLARHVTDFNSAKNVMSNYVEIHGISCLNKIILKGLDDTTLTFSPEYFKIFLRTLDCYIWLLRDQLIDNNLFFSQTNKSWDVIFNCINNLTSKILNTEFHKMTLTNFRNEFQENFLCCKTILSLFDFIIEILVCKFPETTLICEKLLNENVVALISRCLLEPRRAGFDMKNIAMMDLLPNQLEKLINTISTHTSSKYIDAVVYRLDDDIKNVSLQLFKVKQDNPSELTINLSVTKGLLILQKCEIFKKLSVASLLLLQANDKSKSIFNALKLEENTNLWCVELESEQKDYLGHLLEIHLNHQATTIKMMIEIFLTDKTYLRVPASKGSRKILHAEFFFDIFRDVIARCLLNYLVETLQELFNWLQHNPDIVFFILEQLAMYLQQHRNELAEIVKTFANELIGRFSEFEHAINNFESREKSFMNIYRIVIRFKDEPLDISIERGPMYIWILNELSKSTDLSKKACLLNNFLICLTGENTEDDYTVKFILRELKKYRGDVNSSERNTLLSAKAKECYQSLLTLLPITKSNLVYNAIIDFSMGAAKFFCSEATSGYLKKYFNQISPTNALKSLEDAYRLFMSTVASNERFDILDYFLLPSIKFCDASLLEQFYNHNIVEIFKTIWQQLPNNSSDCQRILVSQIGSYSLIELMFAHLELTKINDKYSGDACNILQNSTTGLVPQRIFRCTFEVRKLKTDVTENKDIVRQLHCRALNCCITIASVIREENYFIALFAENASKDQLIWQRIVDCDKKYVIAQTFMEFPKKRRMLVNIKQSIKNQSNKNSASYSCIKSYDLASSTLNDDIRAYDFSEVNLLPEPLYSTAAVTLEVDELNNHECMPSICGILKVMSEINSELASQSEEEPPKSLCYFASSMCSVHYNAQLFMLKIILNNQAVFKPFAEIFLLPIINVIILMLNEGPLNYVLTDALLVLIDWATVAVPKKCKVQAQEMFSCVIDKVDTLEMTKYIVRYNFSIIELLVNVWHECLDIPRGLSQKMKDSQACAIRIILILLANKMEQKLKDRSDILQFLLTSLDVFQHKKEDTLLQICEAIGLFLKMKYSYMPEDLLSPENRTLKSIREVLRSLQENTPERLVKCVHALAKSYPILSQFFFEFVSHNHLKLSPPNKARCMEVFLQKIEYMTSKDIVRELNYMKFNDLLRHKVMSCEKICLEIIQRLISILNATEIFTLANSASLYSQHNNVEYRQLTYNIFINVYKKYVDDITEDYHTQMLVKMSKKILVLGLLDPAEELQQKMMIFWTEEIKLSDKFIDRLLNILDVYLPDVEKFFLTILTVIMLHLTTKSPTYRSKMFEPLAHSCNFKNYEIAALWRVKNLTYRVPLFASSYASQYSQRYTLSSLTVDDLISTNHGLMLRATDVPEFEPTIQNKSHISQSIVADLSYDSFDLAAPEAPTTNIFSKRFMGKLWSTKHPKSRRLEGNYTRHYTQKSDMYNQRKAVKLSRTYRIGDFPDIEITHESFINPLQELIKQDQLVCKDLAVSMICSLLDQLQDGRDEKINRGNFMKNFQEKLNNVLENRQGNGFIISAVLEIMFHIEDIPFNSNIVGNVSKSTGSTCLGALLLERNLVIHPENLRPPTKRRRKAIGETAIDSCSQIDNWIKLAEIYESTSEVDIALSIFLNHVPGPAKLHIACSARAENRLDEALDAYTELYQSEFGAIKRYSHQAMIECLGRLSNWDQIFDDIKGNTGEERTLDRLIENANLIEKGWMSTWFFQAGIYLIFNEIRLLNEFLDDLMTLMKKPIKVQCLKELFAEEIAAICAIDEPEVAQDFLNCALNNVREKWTQISPLSTSLRAREVIKMRGICNVDLYEKIVKDPNKIQTILLKYWSNSVPDVQDDLLPWDYHISYRSNFIRGLLPNIENPNNCIMNDESAHISHGSLLDAVIKLKLRMIEVGFLQKNKYIMKKYSEFVERDIEKGNGILKNLTVIKDQFILNVPRYRILRGETGNNADKLKFYSSGWKKAEEVLKDATDINTKIAVRHLISDFSLRVCEFKRLDNKKYSELIKNIDNIISKYENIFTDEFGKLYSCSFTNLVACCTDALQHSLPFDKIADCHLRLLKFCNDRLMIDPKNAKIIKEFVRSTLKAMSYGSREAAYYFPCLLKPKYFENAETKEVFIEESERIPSWRFLMWRSELLLTSTTSLDVIITPIVRNLIEKYPNAIIYTLRSIIDTNPKLSNHPAICRYKRRLLFQSDGEKFVEALQYLVRPELYLQYYLNLLLKHLDKGREAVVDMVLKKVYPESQSPSLQGNIYKSIALYRREIERIKEIPEADIQKHIIELHKELDQMLKTRKDSNDLKDYSPYLSQFVGSNIEVPGQYTGERKPILEYHTKIVKIESKIQVMKSHRKPIKITFIGNDAKNYNFLVKFGEDLRLDEKVVQAFGIMNDILQADIACSQRYLSIDTYQVITLSGSFGLIQWVDDTKTLQDFINFTLNEEQKRRCDSVRLEYDIWIANASSGQEKRQLQYKEALIKYDAKVVNDKMTQLMKKIEWDLLRRTFLVLSPSLESFMSLRRNFLMTYASMCIAQWILGIGDRHLENILISIKSGRSMGIDFASAFGGGVDQLVPELAPFRLTNQIKGLMKPFDEHDRFAMIMTHVLRALRNGKGPLVAYLDVVTQENLNWEEHVKDLSLAVTGGERPGILGLHRQKIKSVMSKLNGDKPSNITLEELKHQHYDGKYYPRYFGIVSGNDYDHGCIRSQILTENNLTPENQIKCLLDQATDLNILGRTYSGWCPWI